MAIALFNRVRPRAEVPVVEGDVKTDAEAASSQTSSVDEKVPEYMAADKEAFTPDAQGGVQAIEATTTVWTKTALFAVYVMIWVIYFVDTMQQNTSMALGPYVTSAFGRHGLLGATGVVSSIVGGLIKLPLAKVIDIWGRPQGYLLMIIVLTIGLIMMAACENVETYAAAQVFYWVGYNGLTYVLGIFIADTSKLRNRAFMFAYASSPYLATTWIGGPIATAFLKGPGWRWGFGAWSIITPAVTLPLFFVFWFNLKKAEKLNVLPKQENNRTFMESATHYFHEFDVVGLFFLMGGLALFLLPFSLYSYQAKGWESAMIIAMLVIGFVMLLCFVIWEKFYARVTFIPYQLLTDRTVLGACVLCAALFISFFLWNIYFGSFLQVVLGLSITEASYIANIYSMGSCFFALIVGLLIRYTGRFKWLALYFGVPVTILGVGLLIHFRQPDTPVGYVIMCQIFIAFAGGTLVICEQMAAMAATSHQYVAVVLAMEGMFSSVGGAIGSTVAAAIWTATFPNKLQEYLPPGSDVIGIYGSIVTQLSYAPGTPERIAINRAYGYAMQCQCIAATAVLSLAVISVVAWKDIKISNYKQVKGVVI